MWADLPAQWQAYLELAWESYREGSIPIAAVICDRDLKLVRFGARDAWSGSTNLLDASPYLRWKAVKAIPPDIPWLESVIHIFQVDNQLNSDHPRVREVLARWESVYPGDVHLGRKAHQEGILKHLAEDCKEAQQVIDELALFVESGNLSQ